MPWYPGGRLGEGTAAPKALKSAAEHARQSRMWIELGEIVDLLTGLTHVPRMATQAKMTQKGKASVGTQIAAKLRAKANLLSDEQRLAHRSAAMKIIYGNPGSQVSYARSR